MSLNKSISFAVAVPLLAVLAGCSGTVSSSAVKVPSRQPPLVRSMACPTERASVSVAMTALNSRRSLDVPRRSAGSH